MTSPEYDPRFTGQIQPADPDGVPERLKYTHVPPPRRNNVYVIVIATLLVIAFTLAVTYGIPR